LRTLKRLRRQVFPTPSIDGHKLTIEKLANEAIAEMADFYNMVGADIIAVLTDLGHVRSIGYKRGAALLICT
jgi:hypothetical protein